MEQGFPVDAPWRQVPLLTIVWHVVMLTLAVASLGALFVTSRSRSDRDYRWMWAMVLLVAPLAVGYAASRIDPIIRDDVRPFVVGYVLFAGLVSLIGLWREEVRLKNRRGMPWSSVAVICLVSLGFFIYVSLPRVPMAREAARRSHCRNNLKQIGIALKKFSDAHDGLPDPASGDPPMSWRIGVLPFLDLGATSEKYDSSRPWDDIANLALARQPNAFYQCPSRRSTDKDERQRWFTDYVRISGPGTAGETGRRIHMAEIPDGASQTMLVAEAAGLNIVWTEPRDFDASRQPIGINLKGTGKYDSPGVMSSYHAAGGHFLMADGAVRFVNENVDPRILKALTTRDAGDRIGDDF